MKNMLKELCYNYFDRADVIFYEDACWVMSNIERIARENDIDLTDEQLCELTDELMEEY